MNLYLNSESVKEMRSLPTLPRDIVTNSLLLSFPSNTSCEIESVIISNSYSTLLTGKVVNVAKSCTILLIFIHFLYNFNLISLL